jgi:hypothetical protein
MDNNCYRGRFNDRYNSVLDIGCKYGVHLFDAFHSIKEAGLGVPTRLIGIDNVQYGSSFRENYIIYSESLFTLGYRTALTPSDIDLCFSHKQMDMLDYEFDSEYHNQFGLVIARNSLHFITKEQRNDMMINICNGMREFGLIYMRIMTNGVQDGLTRHYLDDGEIEKWSDMFKCRPLLCKNFTSRTEKSRDIIFRKLL